MAVCPAGCERKFEGAPIYGVACRNYNKNCRERDGKDAVSTGVLQLLGSVVGLYRFRLYDDCGIASLHVLTLRRDGARHVAGCQSQRYRQAGQQG